MALDTTENDEQQLLEPVQRTAPRASTWDPVDDSQFANSAKEPARARAPTQQPPDARQAEDLTRERTDPLESEGGHAPRAGRPRRRTIAMSVGLLLALAAAPASYVYWDYGQHFESTDDAFIAARQFTVAPQVSGNVTAVPVTDNQHVRAGDVIAKIDDRNYRVSLEQAQAQIASAQAGLQNNDAQIAVQQAQISANQAQVGQASAALTFAEQQAARYEQLAQTGAGSIQNAQLYSSQLQQQQAALQSARANLALAQRQIASLRAQRAIAVATLAQADAQRDQAALNLSYTTVTAGQAGRVVNLGAAVGEYAQAGSGLTTFVPDELWIIANFKESQLDFMRPGQPATFHVDAYPDRIFHGHVASVQPGSGTAFSLLPAENATGNYVKIVQRVPVKIVMDDLPKDVALGPGMSVTPIVRVDPNPSLFERLRGRL